MKNDSACWQCIFMAPLLMHVYSSDGLLSMGQLDTRKNSQHFSCTYTFAGLSMVLKFLKFYKLSWNVLEFTKCTENCPFILKFGSVLDHTSKYLISALEMNQIYTCYMHSGGFSVPKNAFAAW